MNEQQADDAQVWLNYNIRITVEKCTRIISNLIENCPDMPDAKDDVSDKYIKECILEAIYNIHGNTITGMQDKLYHHGFDSDTYTPLESHKPPLKTNYAGLPC